MFDTVTPPHASIGGFEEAMQRLIGHLRARKIDIPAAALEPGQPKPYEAPYEALAPLDKALMAAFDYRDFEQAHALLHRRQSTTDWCVLRPAAVWEARLGLSDPTLCPSNVLALELLVRLCDQQAVRIERCWRRGAALVVESAGKTLATVEPIAVEPFDRNVRDRVRSAFKGVRERDYAAIQRRATRLPGLKGLPWRELPWHGPGRLGCMLFGYPANWAIAIRGALRDVGVSTKLSEALEAAAAYLGASSWHELIRHDSEPFASFVPVGVAIRDNAGQVKWSYFSTPEEALWATAKMAARSPLALAIDSIEASFESRHRVCAFLPGATTGLALGDAGPGIECATHELWSSSGEASASTFRAAKLLLSQATARESGGSAAPLLYTGTTPADLMLGIMERSGIPPTQLVIGNEHFCVVEHRERRGTDNGDEMAHEAILSLYDVKHNEVRPSVVLSMYKAEVTFAERDGKPALVIRGDYGNDDPVTITFPTARRRQQLLDLTHADGLFSLVGGPRAA